MAILSESRKVSSRGEYVTYKLLNDEANLNVTSDAVDVRNAKGISLVVEAGANATSGVIALEGSQTSDYAGVWATLDSATITAASAAYGASVEASSGNAMPPFVRARISTSVGGGGSADVYLNVQY